MLWTHVLVPAAHGSFLDDICVLGLDTWLWIHDNKNVKKRNNLNPLGVKLNRWAIGFN